MIFTNQIEMNDQDACYYRKAYSPECFNMLSLDEKHLLINFTVAEFSDDVTAVYSDELGDEIGILTEQDVLWINNKILLKANQTDSLELYLFLYRTLMQRIVTRIKNFIPVAEDSYIHIQWRKKDYQHDTLDRIVLHMLFDELIELQEHISLYENEKKYFSEVIEKISTSLSQIQGSATVTKNETLKEQAAKSETNIISVNRER